MCDIFAKSIKSKHDKHVPGSFCSIASKETYVGEKLSEALLQTASLQYLEWAAHTFYDLSQGISVCFPSFSFAFIFTLSEQFKRIVHQ